MRIKPVLALLLAFGMVVAACGDDSGDATSDAGANGDADASESEATSGEDDGSASSGGNVADAPPAGEAVAMVDGLEYTFDQPGGLPCEVSDDEFSFSFRIGDNEVVVGGGATRSDGEWFGSMSMQVFADNNVTDYSANILDNPDAIQVDGESVSYTGPMRKSVPTDDGSPPDVVDAGTGTISFTCA